MHHPLFIGLIRTIIWIFSVWKQKFFHHHRIRMYVGYMRMALIISIITVFRWTTSCSSSLVWPLLSPSPLSALWSWSSSPITIAHHHHDHHDPHVDNILFNLTFVTITIIIITTVFMWTTPCSTSRTRQTFCRTHHPCHYDHDNHFCPHHHIMATPSLSIH